MTFSLLLLGSIREVIGTGKLFTGIENLLGNWAAVLHVEIFPLHNNFLLAILPPGAFLTLGFTCT